MTHQMSCRLVEIGASREYVFLCEECGRHLVFDCEDKMLTVIEQGDEWAGHAASLGGMNVGLVVIEEQVPVPPVFEEFIDTLD